jgi:hypothetical protein
MDVKKPATIYETYMWVLHIWNGLMEIIIKRMCCNLSLGLATKARACKGASQEESPRVTSPTPRNVGECEGM